MKMGRTRPDKEELHLHMARTDIMKYIHPNEVCFILTTFVGLYLYASKV
jgi:hypothetical protein